MQEAKKRASRSAANTFSRGAFTVISPVSFICRPSLLPPNASARLAVPAGLEPATFGLGNRCSIRLSYGTGTISINGSAGRRNRQGGAGIFPDQVRSRRGNELGEKKKSACLPCGVSLPPMHPIVVPPGRQAKRAVGNLFYPASGPRRAGLT